MKKPHTSSQSWLQGHVVVVRKCWSMQYARRLEPTYSIWQLQTLLENILGKLACRWCYILFSRWTFRNLPVFLFLLSSFLNLFLSETWNLVVSEEIKRGRGKQRSDVYPASKSNIFAFGWLILKIFAMHAPPGSYHKSKILLGFRSLFFSLYFVKRA